MRNVFNRAFDITIGFIMNSIVIAMTLGVVPVMATVIIAIRIIKGWRFINNMRSTIASCLMFMDVLFIFIRHVSCDVMFARVPKYADEIFCTKEFYTELLESWLWRKTMAKEPIDEMWLDDIRRQIDDGEIKSFTEFVKRFA